MIRLIPILTIGILLTACQPKSTESDQAPIPFAQASVQSSPPAVETAATTVPEPIDTTPARAPHPNSTLLGKINPASDPDFARIAQKYTTKSGIYMRKAAYAAFEEMHAAAAADGIKLKIISATRTFGAQKGIWERKWNGQTIVEGQNLAKSVPDPVERATKILRFSSMPGTSRHHWGTDIDLNNLNNSYFASGEGKKVYDWLTANAGTYGFCQVYSPINEDRMHGYQEEKWHWSYLPIAQEFLSDYQAHVSPDQIQGFKGAEVAAELQVIDHYVSGINQDCKE